MDYRIEDMPESEKPREKLEDHGTDQLTDTELLSIILRTGTKGKNVKQLSGEILSDHSFQDLLNVSRDQLERFEGVSTVKSGQIKAATEIANRMQREERSTLEKLEQVRSETADMKMLDEEKLRVFYLNSGNEVLSRKTFDGEVSSVNVRPKKILENALSVNAAAIILAHNHPSGKAEPTDADRSFTREFSSSAETLGIDLLDHVIVGESVFSFRQSTTVLDR